MERDRLIAEIARQTGISLDRADPVLAAATINQILLDEARAELQRLLRTSADQLSAASLQQIEAAKTAAAALITDAGTWSAERLREAASEASTTVVERLQQEAVKAEHAGHIALRAAWAAAGISALALAAIAGFVLATIGHG
jgi:Transcriptional activator TraM